MGDHTGGLACFFVWIIYVACHGNTTRIKVRSLSPGTLCLGGGGGGLRLGGGGVMVSRGLCFHPSNWICVGWGDTK